MPISLIVSVHISRSQYENIVLNISKFIHCPFSYSVEFFSGKVIMEAKFKLASSDILPCLRCEYISYICILPKASSLKASWSNIKISVAVFLKKKKKKINSHTHCPLFKFFFFFLIYDKVAKHAWKTWGKSHRNKKNWGILLLFNTFSYTIGGFWYSDLCLPNY